MKNVTRVRTGELRQVFNSGNSELLNAIARLAILYEDLRFEMRELRAAYRKVIELGEEDTENRVPYFLRQALGTLVEFGGGLNFIRSLPEFKRAVPFLTSMDADYISEVDRFIQQNWSRIKELRNEFGGHIQRGAVDFAVKHLTKEVGTVRWSPEPDTWTIGIECDFARVLLGGVIQSKLQAGTDVLEELGKAISMLGMSFGHAQAAMVALVHAFLWDRFGR